MLLSDRDIGVAVVGVLDLSRYGQVKVLEVITVSTEIVSLIEEMYMETTVVVRVELETLQQFGTEVGIGNGSSLSPQVFSRNLSQQ